MLSRNPKPLYYNKQIHWLTEFYAMKKYSLLFFVIFIVALNSFGQTSVPKPSPTPSDEGDVVKITTNLIQIDVTVTDKSGQPIRDLKPDELQIYENGKLQPISNFSFVSGSRLSVAENAKKQPKSADPLVNLPSTPIRPEQVRRTIALAVDDLNLSFSSVFWVREALKKFVNEQMQEGDLVAIVRTGGGIGMLQQFTTDKRQLFAAIDKVKFNLSGNARTSLFDPISPTLNEEFGVPNPDAEKDDSIAAAKDAENKAFRTEIFATGTLGALNFVVRGMKELPGRKSVVLLSEGFNLIDRKGTQQQPSRIVDALQRLIDLANRNTIVFNNIDPRGLQFVMKEAQDDLSNVRSERADQLLADRQNILNDTQDGLRYLAHQTGGIAIINQNDISHGIRRVLDDQSYYLVGYLPNDETFDAKKVRYNQIDVKVSRPGTRVRFRSGFYSVASENISNKLDPTAAIVDAITSPFAATGVTVRMNALFVSDAKRGLNLHTFVNVDPKDITFTKQSNGRYKAVFDVFAMTYGDNGTILDQRYSRATVLADQNEYERIIKRGMVSDFTVAVKKPGGYQLRLAIRDKESGRVGSANQFVEVPDLGNKQLSVSGAVLSHEPFAAGQAKVPDPKFDTTIKQFRKGSVLQYDYYVYNAVLDASQKSNVTYRLKLYHDGKVVFEGGSVPLQNIGYEAMGTISTSGVVQLGSDLLPGDYILQAEITDHGSSRKNNKVNQFVQFEIVD